MHCTYTVRLHLAKPDTNNFTQLSTILFRELAQDRCTEIELSWWSVWTGLPADLFPVVSLNLNFFLVACRGWWDGRRGVCLSRFLPSSHDASKKRFKRADRGWVRGFQCFIRPKWDTHKFFVKTYPKNAQIIYVQYQTLFLLFCYCISSRMNGDSELLINSE